MEFRVEVSLPLKGLWGKDTVLQCKLIRFMAL